MIKAKKEKAVSGGRAFTSKLLPVNPAVTAITGLAEVREKDSDKAHTRCMVTTDHTGMDN